MRRKWTIFALICKAVLLFFFSFNYIVWSIVYLSSFREIESSHKEEPEIQSIEDRGGGDLLLAGIKISVMGIK